MKTLWIFCASFIFLAVRIDATLAGGEKLWDVLSATRQRRTDATSCQKASQVFGQLIEVGQDMMVSRYLPALNLFVNFDAFDAVERENFVCQFSDLSTVQDLIDVAQNNGLLDHLIRRVYDYLTVFVMITKPELVSVLENPDEYSWDTTEDQLMLNLINSLESTGFLLHDPEGTQQFLEMFREMFGEFNGANYIAEPLSDEQFNALVNKVTNDLREVWNNHVKEVSEWIPDYSQKLRDNIKEWSGITIGNHGDMRRLVGTMLGSAEDGLHGITTSLQPYAEHAVKKCYSMLIDDIDYIQSMLELQTDYYSDYYADNGAYMAYQATTIEMIKNLLSLLDSLREMGFFSLDQDL